MVGGVLFNSIIDFLELQAKQMRDGVEEHLLQFILQKGIKLRDDKAYFFVWDENAQAEVACTLKMAYEMNIDAFVSCTTSTVALTTMLDEHMPTYTGIIRLD